MSSSSASSSPERSPPPPSSASKKRKVDVAEIEVDVTAPEPPSKKALRRLKKGKTLTSTAPRKPSDKNDDADLLELEDDDKSGKKSGSDEKAQRSPHGVWIGNLAWSVSKADLRTFITQHAEITDDEITRVHMPPPADNKTAGRPGMKKFHNKGFAYVDFSSAEAVTKVLDVSEQLFNGRRVLIKDHTSFEGRPAKPASTEDGAAAEGTQHGKAAAADVGVSKRVFIGNLTFDATEDLLREHFEKCGPIEHIMIATFEDSGKCKGYAWVTFEEVEGAKNAVQGFVRVPEEDEEDEEESESESSSSDDDDEDGQKEDSKKKSKKKEKKVKMRKWWVNRFKGRPLRMEFAEDASTRYKKRFGKAKGSGEDAGGERQQRPPRRERPADNGQGGDRAPREKKEYKPKKVEYRTEYAPRLTGGIVESKGKKTTF